MGMVLSDFALAAIFGAAGIAATVGGSMMLSQEHPQAAIVCFYFAGAMFWLAGVVWAVNAAGYKMPIRLLVAAIVGGGSAMAAVWLATLASAKSQDDSNNYKVAQNSTTQNNQGAPNINIPGSSNSVIVNPIPAPQSQQTIEAGEITQAGLVVGKVFAARRLPTDATIFEFAEIKNCGQFNTSAPFYYNRFKLMFISERNSAMLDVSRAQDSPIRYGVLAKIIE